ncbi:GCN5-like 1, partial [Metarhizium majus ARSEF 297]
MSTAASSPPRHASPPTSLSIPPSTAAPTQPHAITAHASPAAPLQQTLPSQETQRHVAEARAAVVASMGNLIDSQLQSRAGILHDNAAALDKQERDVVRATEGLRRETEKLAREADAAARRVKELGNVQNWAEVLERGFLVLEETVRLANRQDGGSESGSGSCSCSECGGDESGGGGDNDDDGEYGEEGMMDVDVDLANSMHRDGNKVSLEAKGPAREGLAVGADADMVMTGAEAEDGGRSTWSDASRSLMEPDSSTGTGRAKGSETASLSTES